MDVHITKGNGNTEANQTPDNLNVNKVTQNDHSELRKESPKTRQIYEKIQQHNTINNKYM